MNAGRWTPTADDLRGPRVPLPPAMSPAFYRRPADERVARKPTPPEAFQARPITSDPDVLSAYFSQVASYEADRLRSYRRTARLGFTVGAIGAVVGLAGVLSVAAPRRSRA